MASPRLILTADRTIATIATWRSFGRGPVRGWGDQVMTIHRLMLVSVLSVLTGCQSTQYADRGAGVGALTGALAGAAIGENNDRPITGAVIGTAVGALAGASIGDSMDRDVEYRAAANAAAQSALTMPDVIEMSESGLSDDVIVRQIRRDGVRRNPDKHDLVQLTRAGVSDRVIEELQSAGSGPVVMAPRRTTVVEHHYSSPPHFQIQWHNRHRFHGHGHRRW
jgi:hypothetical protein